MKQFKIITLILLIVYNIPSLSAQISDNPINILSEKLLQNELMANRFIKNFVFIKSNTFRKKTMADMDKSIALFDNNLSYVILHLPDNKKVKEDFMKLQNFWNIYRINVTDFTKENYKSLMAKTFKLRKYIRDLNKNVFERHPQYSKNKKAIELAKLAVENSKKIDGIATAYILKNVLKVNNSDVYFDLDMASVNKNLKKIGKYKQLNTKAKDIIADLKNTAKSIYMLLHKEKVNPKMIYAYDSSFGKKNFKLFKYIIQTIE